MAYMSLLEGMYNGIGEGNISWFPNRMDLLKRIITETKPTKLIEIGFNMGHSAKLTIDSILSIDDPEYQQQEKIFYIFDICKEEYVKPNFAILNEFYKNEKIKIIFIEGNSKDTLDRTLSEHNISNLDFVNIDGEHTEEAVISDILSVKDRMKLNGTIYIDDYNYVVIQNGINRVDWLGYTKSVEANAQVLCVKKVR